MWMNGSKVSILFFHGTGQIFGRVELCRLCRWYLCPFVFTGIYLLRRKMTATTTTAICLENWIAATSVLLLNVWLLVHFSGRYGTYLLDGVMGDYLGATTCITELFGTRFETLQWKNLLSFSWRNHPPSNYNVVSLP